MGNNKKTIQDIQNMTNEELLKHVVKTGVEKKIITPEDVVEINEGLQKTIPNKSYDLSEFLPKEEPSEDEE